MLKCEGCNKIIADAGSSKIDLGLCSSCDKPAIKNKISYMRMALAWSMNSSATRNKVGCLIVKDKRIISDGYNGTPKGFDNRCEFLQKGEYITKPEVLHAESNAISKIATSTISSEGSFLFTTLAPCFDCAKLIIQSGIICVYYKEDYKTKEGLILLNRALIPTIKLSVESS